MADAWSPEQYQRFQSERAQPFFDLLSLWQPGPVRHAVDLGCGTGELTVQLHRRTGATTTLGLDASASMLARAAPLAADGLRFEQGDLAAFAGGPVDVLFSNAAVQWVPDHAALLPRLWRQLAPGGQLLVQMPANHDHLSHTLAAALASEPPFREALGGYVRQSPVQPPEWYSEALEQLGATAQHVRLQVYGHRLDGPESVVEWVKGTLLTDYEARLPAPLFGQFVDTYRARLVAALPDRRPYFYAFKRLLLWARAPGPAQP